MWKFGLSFELFWNRNQRGVLVVFELAQSLKDKPVTPLSGDIRDLAEATATRLKRDFDCVGLDYNAFYPGEAQLEALERLLNAGEYPAEYQVFFYHSDHLGSSSFITDANGDATQHLQYLPFGEDLVHEQNTAAYLSPYTFSGKERDVETNLSYFGARYYEAGLSVWLSVDPKAESRPWLSPYNYCQFNPVLRIDPNGALDHIFDEQPDGSWKRREGVKNDGGNQHHTFVHRNGNTSYYDVRTNQMNTVKAGTIEKATKQYQQQQQKINRVIEKTGKVVNTTGDVIAAAGYVAAPFTEGASLTVALVGEGISVAGLFIEHSARVSRDGFSSENVTGIAVDAAFETAPAPVEAVLKRAQFEDPVKKLIKAQINKVNMGVEYGVKQNLQSTEP